MNDRLQHFMKHFPPEKEILQMEPEELAPFILSYLKKEGHKSGQLNRHNFGNNMPSDGQLYRCMMEAWWWLEREGFLAAKGDSSWVFVTRKGEKIGQEEGFASYMQAAIFPADLDAVLIRLVRPMFLRSDYDTAVFRAFKEVEVRVRTKSGLGDDLIGRELMVRAFGPTGPLTNPDAPKGEQDAARELFSGAISFCKNPSSHREVQFEKSTGGRRSHLLCKPTSANC